MQPGGEPALQAEAVRLRTLVDGLAAQVGGERRQKQADNALPCELPGAADGWPKQWAYTVRVLLPGDGTPAMRQVVQRLTAQGWRVEPDRTATAGEARATAYGPDGEVLGLIGGPPDPPAFPTGVVQLQGFSRCVARS